MSCVVIAIVSDDLDGAIRLQVRPIACVIMIMIMLHLAITFKGGGGGRESEASASDTVTDSSILTSV